MGESPPPALEERRELVEALAHRSTQDEHIRARTARGSAPGTRSPAPIHSGEIQVLLSSHAGGGPGLSVPTSQLDMPKLRVRHQLAVGKERRPDSGAEGEHDDGARRVARPAPPFISATPTQHRHRLVKLLAAPRWRARASRRPLRSSRDPRWQRCARCCSSRRSGTRKPTGSCTGEAAAPRTATCFITAVGCRRLAASARDRRRR